MKKAAWLLGGCSSEAKDFDMKTQLRTHLFIAGALLLFGVQTAVAAPVTLSSLIRDMQDSPATMGSQLQEQYMTGVLSEQQAKAGWSLYGGVDAGNYRELEYGGRQKYSGTGATIGLRYPLLGAMQSRRAAIIEAEIALEQAHHSVALTRAEQQQQLRQIYIDWWRQEVLGHWCHQQQTLATAELSQAVQRSGEQHLRYSEQLWIEQRWQRLLHICVGNSEQVASQRQQLAYLHGNRLPADAEPVAEPLPTQLAPAANWVSLLEEHPALLTRRSEAEALQTLAKQHWGSQFEAHFSLGQNFNRRSDIHGQGSGTVAAITFDVPLASLTGNSSRSSGAARYSAAQQRVLDTRHGLVRALEQGLHQYQQQLTLVEARIRQLQHARQLIREQQARTGIDQESGFMAHRLALLEKSETELELINDWHAGWSLLAQLQVLSEGNLPVMSVQALNWQTPELPPALAQAQAAASRTDWSHAIYIWDSSALLDLRQRQEQVNQLISAGFNHVYLGFDSSQVNQLALLETDIRSLIGQLKQQGFTVDLLLGDPAWLRPAQSPQLMQLIEKFARLPFDHLHLDLEVEQLGWPVPPGLLQDWLDTLQQAVRVSPWPVSLVSHHRWFAPEQRSADTCIPCALPELGIQQVTLMLYSTATTSVVQRTQQIVTAWPGLQLQLAQSVETSLPPENSYFRFTASQLGQLGKQLHDQLAPTGLAGLAWQDWAHYPRDVSRKSEP